MFLQGNQRKLRNIAMTHTVEWTIKVQWLVDVKVSEVEGRKPPGWVLHASKPAGSEDENENALCHHSPWCPQWPNKHTGWLNFAKNDQVFEKQ